MTEPVIRVRRDQASGTWRVTCPLHGLVSASGNFWTASRDKAGHEELCDLFTHDEDP